MPQQKAYRPTPTSPTTPTATPTRTAIEDLDDFMNEIDDLLEEHALEVVTRYVQKPGE